MKPPLLTCYSLHEGPWMAAWDKARRWALAPLLRLLTWLGVSPGFLTTLGLALGLLGAANLAEDPAWGVAYLALHLALDGLDGPLARWQGRASSAGALWDMTADLLVVLAVTLALAEAGAAPVRSALLFGWLYLALLVVACARQRLGRPFRLLVRPRFVLYAALTLPLFGVPLPLLAMDLLLSALNALMSAFVTWGALVLHDHLKGEAS
jgi:phosphatidylglycerophosphate synthase